MLERFGKPEARIVPGSLVGFTRLRHTQLRTAGSGEALHYAKRFVAGKIRFRIVLVADVGRDPGFVLVMEEASRLAELADCTPSLHGAEGRT